MMLLQMLVMDILPSEHREESQIQLLFSRVFLCSGMGNFMTAHTKEDNIMRTMAFQMLRKMYILQQDEIILLWI